MTTHTTALLTELARLLREIRDIQEIGHDSEGSILVGGYITKELVEFLEKEVGE